MAGVSTSISHFNSRPREEASFSGWFVIELQQISILAPVRRRRRPCAKNRRAAHFNSRPREEASCHGFVPFFRICISILAPVRRRPVVYEIELLDLTRHFNSRPREEASSSLTPVRRFSGEFQFSPP